MDEFARFERRLRALEQNQGATLRFCEVTAVDEAAGSARVRIEDADKMVTMPLRVLQRRTLKDQHQELPDLGEHVACLFTGQGFEQGIVLGAVYSGKDPAPGKPPQVWYRKFEDGTELEYDREERKLRIELAGAAEVTAMGKISVTASAKITLTAPEIELNGNLTSRSGSGAKFVSGGQFSIDAAQVTINEGCE